MSAQSKQLPNPAFRAALERVIDDERVVLASALAKLRLVISGLVLLVGVRTLLLPEPSRYYTSLAVTLAYVAASVVVWRLLKQGKLVKRAGWVIPLLDVPLIAIAQVLQTSQLPVPWMGMVNSTAMILTFVVVSGLSLSRSAVLLTAAIGLVPLLYRAWYVKLNAVPFAMTMISFGALTATMIVLVGRIRGLVHASRAQDLLGKYLLGKRIGSGGMAEVFQATYSPEGGLERQVALKRILPSFAGHKDAIALFRREAEIGVMLNHPCVVQVLDFGTHADTCFLAMEARLRRARAGARPTALVAGQERLTATGVMRGKLDAAVLGLLERDLTRRTPTAAELRRTLMQLPRELLDGQEGRRIVAQRVAKAREAGAGLASATAPVRLSPTDATQTTETNLPP